MHQNQLFWETLFFYVGFHNLKNFITGCLVWKFQQIELFLPCADKDRLPFGLTPFFKWLPREVLVLQLFKWATCFTFFYYGTNIDSEGMFNGSFSKGKHRNQDSKHKCFYYGHVSTVASFFRLAKRHVVRRDNRKMYVHLTSTSCPCWVKVERGILARRLSLMFIREKGCSYYKASHVFRRHTYGGLGRGLST